MKQLESYPYPLPGFTVKTEYGPKKFTMPLADSVQLVAADKVQLQMQRIDDIYQSFAEVRKWCQTSLRFLASIPLDIRKAPNLWTEAAARQLVPEPFSAMIRLDTVNGKVVDINNKAVGLGLTMSAYRNWEELGILDSQSALSPTYANLLIDGKPGTIVTEKSYPFANDQQRLAKLLAERTDQEWRVMFPEIGDPTYIDGKNIFSFSYLDKYARWRRYCVENPDQFAVNPLAAMFWDNKAWMALPFLKLDVPDPLRSSLLGLREVFPPTYLFRNSYRSRYEHQSEKAIAITPEGLVYQPISAENVPVLGKSYFKPLCDSGSRGVQTKLINDWGGSYNAIKQYTPGEGGFIVQQAVDPLQQDGCFIKDGYFVNTITGKAQLTAIERMGSLEETDKIHGGSKTLLIPVELSNIGGR